MLYQNDNLLGESNSYKELCDKIIKKCLSLGYDVVLIPHVVGEEKGADNDYFISVEVSKKHGLPEPPFFQSPKEVKNYISRCHFFVGSRMHATIGAVSCGVPTLPLAYSRKFKGVFNSIHYQHTMDLKANSQDEILVILENMLTLELQQTINDVAAALRVVKQKTDSYVSDIKSIIQKV